MEFNTDEIMTYIATYGLQVLGALVTFIIGKWCAKLAKKFLNKVMQKAKIDPMLTSFTTNIAYALLLTFVVLASLERLGIETTSIAAIFAAAGLAIGLSLQGSLSNFAAGVMLIIFRPFNKGDYIEAAGTSGTVSDISIFTTTLKTPDNRVIIIPNSGVTDGNITNYSAENQRRVDMVFGIGYDDDIKETKAVLEKILKDDSRILPEPAPVIAVSELADSSINFVVRPWVKTSDYWAVLFDTTEKVKEEFDKAGLSIPYPQQDLHIHNVDKSADTKEAA